MVYILIGEDTVSSRTKMLSLIAKDSEVIRLDGKKIAVSEVLDAFESNSLFTKKRTIILEYFIKIKPQEALFKNAVRFIKDPDTTLIFWDEQDLSSKLVGVLKGANVLTFTFPKVFYQFIDGILPNNKEGSVRLLKVLLKTFEPEQVLYSMTKRIRLLSVLKTGKINEFSEAQKIRGWQLEKLENQAAFWSEKQLAGLLLKLAEADELLKTGGLSIPLSHHLDMILLSDLN
jgi:DNA polymerase III delta subunit